MGFLKSFFVLFSFNSMADWFGTYSVSLIISQTLSRISLRAKLPSEELIIRETVETDTLARFAISFKVMNYKPPYTAGNPI
jgi:hypothetical protein